MTKNDFIAKLAEQTGWNVPEAEERFSHCIEALKSVLLQGEELTVPGFGRFYVHRKAERMGYNPKTGQKIPVDAKAVPMFKAGDALKMYVNNALS